MTGRQLAWIRPSCELAPVAANLACAFFGRAKLPPGGLFCATGNSPCFGAAGNLRRADDAISRNWRSRSSISGFLGEPLLEIGREWTEEARAGRSRRLSRS